MEIDLNPQAISTIVGIALLIGGALFAGPPAARAFGSWLNEEGEVTDEFQMDPDLLPTDGNPICDHVQMVVDTAYAAPPEIQLEYLKKGLTRTAILEAEVARLCKGTPSAN